MLNFRNDTKVSIIVPVYNTAQYLRQCLDSLVNQTLKDIEIICINDGSTDNSLKILKEYADKDERIIIIDQKNSGQSIARNNGLRIAKGEFIGFLDSDDWADERMFEKMYANAKIFESDVVMCSAYAYNEETKETNKDYTYFALDSIFSKRFEGCTFNWIDCADFLFRICVVPWNKIYKRTFLRDNNLKFVEGLNFEDQVFFLDMFTLASKVSIIKENLVFYRLLSETSYTFSPGCAEKKLDLFNVYKHKKEILKKRDIYRLLKRDFEKSSLNDFLFWYKKINDRCVKKKYLKKLILKYPHLLVKKLTQQLINKKAQLKLAHLCAKNTVVFWGASEYLQNFLKKNVKNPHNIIGIIDRANVKQGTYIGCIEVFSPDELKKLNPDIIIPSVKSIDNFEKIIIDKIEELGLHTKVVKIFE